MAEYNLRTTVFSHPDQTSGMHTNGPHNTFIRKDDRSPWYVVDRGVSISQVRRLVEQMGLEEFQGKCCTKLGEVEVGKPSYTKMVEELQEAANLDGTEIGEYWRALASLWSVSLGPGISPPLFKALKEELANQYEFLKEDFRIVEEMVAVKKLQHIDDWEDE